MARSRGAPRSRKRGGAISIDPGARPPRDPAPPGTAFQALTAHNPSPFTLEGTNTYVLGAGGQAVVIDPGPDDGAHVAHVLAYAAAAGRRVGLILLTHRHHDHQGAADALAHATGARVRGWTDPEAPLRDGEGIAVDGGRLQVLHTPGHARDHVVFYWESERVLFSGDLILGEGTVNITPPGGSMADYLQSLERVAGLQLTLIAPGHGPLVRAPHQRITEYLAHRRRREQQVLELLADGPQTAQALVAAIYPDLDPRLRGAAEGTITAHLQKLVDEGRVRQTRASFTLR
ncbi:MAG TPA: MBL fold metallo-hydrolase [bacterium]|nr:MBL fold metallo-hydrolase [bacterium]